ncbi:vanillate O-demethylase oxygenase subunit (plasmid) [Cupriavidus necator N-1]|uniref:Vanillate O-demethylase oxygenase subunit n=1 Tax=Cupriavidus necator (strain ATCC 43291 / DSM 13513 / CCUG 52238 / LMG 8453 / N-1) TaxID=1042878 RepID=F8GVC9_CUPNN|nr:aromatic ring-hydroxylating dioxygenase subunit alpha [Cupriavidus necator]AEI82629.1 vanillate O-demethylase oxygenase subunit [Cupriavidus necator N-1]MDX6007626.1 aromatic ring-hydroxylating dioxygenase subunit alpha [Cupriavidus necator]
MKTQSPYLMNAWYVAALSTEVGPEELFHRKILDVSVMIYRKQDDGTPVAMHDRCPHRFAPLHLGKRHGDEVSCPYHALRFDCLGTCTHNPHGTGHIPKAASVKTFPLAEKYGFVWIWMGDEAPDLKLLPDYSELDIGHANAVGYTYMHMPVNYELIIDNVMDLSHIDHVHGEIITTRGKLSPVIPKVADVQRTVNARWEWTQSPAMMIFANFLPQPEEEARHYFDITWAPPANIQLSVGAVQGEMSFDDYIGQYDLHTTTPETQGSTHYFFATRRNHIVEDGDYNKMKIQAMHGAFENEDGPIISAVQREMGDANFFDLNPVLMSNDVAAVKVRRKLEMLISAERQRKLEE